MTAGTHGSTFGGNPLACAVGLAVLERIFSEKFLEVVREKGIYLKERLRELVIRYPTVFESARGFGLMLGLKCTVQSNIFISKAYKNRLLVVPAGDNVVRLLPPLNITYGELDEALKRLKNAANEVKDEQ